MTSERAKELEVEFKASETVSNTTGIQKGSIMENYFSSLPSPTKASKVMESTGDQHQSISPNRQANSFKPSSKNLKKPQLTARDQPILITNDSFELPAENKGGKNKKTRRAKAKGKKKLPKADLETDKSSTEKTKTPGQSTITQHFPIRRSERRTKSQVKKDAYDTRAKRITAADEEGLEVKVLNDKGRGVFASRPFSRGELVCEYAGDLISIKEAQSREVEYSQSTEYGCYMYYFTYKTKRYCVDATKESDRLGRLLNHSKTGSNVHTELFPINDVPHLILVASRKIEVGEELLYDYGDRSRESLQSHPWLKS